MAHTKNDFPKIIDILLIDSAERISQIGDVNGGLVNGVLIVFGT